MHIIKRTCISYCIGNRYWRRRLWAFTMNCGERKENLQLHGRQPRQHFSHVWVIQHFNGGPFYHAGQARPLWWQ